MNALHGTWASKHRDLYHTPMRPKQTFSGVLEKKYSHRSYIDTRDETIKFQKNPPTRILCQISPQPNGISAETKAC